MKENQLIWQRNLNILEIKVYKIENYFSLFQFAVNVMSRGKVLFERVLFMVANLQPFCNNIPTPKYFVKSSQAYN